jgi:hypothetical protein
VAPHTVVRHYGILLAMALIPDSGASEIGRLQHAVGLSRRYQSRHNRDAPLLVTHLLFCSTVSASFYEFCLLVHSESELRGMQSGYEGPCSHKAGNKLVLESLPKA